MNATELFLPTGKSAGVYCCGQCRHVASDQIMAEQCCQNYKCTRCGQDIGSRQSLICDHCHQLRRLEEEQARFDKAEKVTTWEGPVYCDGFGNDGYCESLEELLEEISDSAGDRPKYAWTCETNHFVNADIDDFLGRIADVAYEDFSLDNLHGVEELKTALAKFNEANQDAVSWSPDYGKVVYPLILSP